MAGKTNYSDSSSLIQKQDRNKIFKSMMIVGLVILVLIVVLFIFHYAQPSDEKTGPINEESAELQMVPTRVKYYDPQQERSYDVGMDYIIINDKDHHYRVDSDGMVTEVSSDGTFIGKVDADSANRTMFQAYDIMNKDKQAKMALDGLDEIVKQKQEAETAEEEPKEKSTIDVIYETAEAMGYSRSDLDKWARNMGTNIGAMSLMVKNGASAEDIVRIVKDSGDVEPQDKKGGKGTGGNTEDLTVNIPNIGIVKDTDAAPAAPEDDSYPPWMMPQDPTAGLEAVMNSLSNATATPQQNTEWQDVNKQKEKDDWAKGQMDREITATKLTRYDLVAGTTVPITIVTGVNTDLPGSIVGIVRQDVYDTLTGTNILIPKGSRLMANYNSSVSFGQKSVQIAWNMLITPDGYEFSLPGFSGTTPDGYAGVKGKYNGHFWQLLGGAMLGSLIDWGAMYSTELLGKGEDTLSQLAAALGGSFINTTSSVGQKYAQMWANLQPTIRIKTGTQTQLLVNQTISLKRPSNNPISTGAMK